MVGWEDDVVKSGVAVVENEFGADRLALRDKTVKRVAQSKRSVTADAIRAIGEEFRQAMRVTLSLPGDAAASALRGGRSVLGGLVVEEMADEDRRMRYSAKEISRSIEMVDTAVMLKLEDPFAIKVLILWAMPGKKKWERIEDADPKSRQRWQLDQLRREALVALWMALREK